MRATTSREERGGLLVGRAVRESLRVSPRELYLIMVAWLGALAIGGIARAAGGAEGLASAGQIARMVAWIEAQDPAKGFVRINGGARDLAAQPEWDWGDGTVTKNWFLAEHTYAVLSSNYAVRVTGTFTDGTREMTAVEVRLGGPGEPRQLQVITFDPPGVVTNRSAGLTLDAKARSGLPVEFQVRQGPAMVAGGRLSFSGVGSVIVRAVQPGNDAWLPVFVERRIEVQRQSQELRWVSPAADVLLFGQATPLEVQASSGLAVTIRLMSGPARMEGGSLTITNRGWVRLLAEQAGNADVAPVAIERTFNAASFSGAVLGRWPSSGSVLVAYALGAKGDSAFLATKEQGLRIVDVATPDAPREVGSVPLKLGVAVQAAGESVHACCGPAGEMLTVDVADPARPMLRGTFASSSAGGFSSIHVVDGVAYLVEGGRRLVMVDVRDSSNPRRLGVFEGRGTVFRVVAASGYAYLAEGNNGLGLLDVRDPSRPVLVGRFAPAGTVRDVAVQGRWAALAVTVGPDPKSVAGLWMVDVSDPARPVEVANLPVPDTTPSTNAPAFVRWEGGLACAGFGFTAPYVIDLGAPDRPAIVGRLPDQGHGAYEVLLVENRAYIAGRAANFTVAELWGRMAQALEFFPPAGVSNGVTSIILGARAESGQPVAFSVVEGPARVEGKELVFTGRGAVTVRAEQAGDEFWRPAVVERSILVRGQMQQVAWAEPVPDIVPPGESVVLQATASSGLPVTYRVESGPGKVDGNRLTVVGAGLVRVLAEQAGDERFEAASSSRSLNQPVHQNTRLGFWPVPLDRGPDESVVSVAVQGSHALVGLGLGGWTVLDVSDPARPLVVATRLPGGWPMTVAGSIAYVAGPGGGPGLSIYDLADPTRPSFLANFQAGGSSSLYSIQAVDGLAYVVDSARWLRVLDVKDPGSPSLLGTFTTEGKCPRAIMDGGYAFLAEGESGLEIVDVRNPRELRQVGRYSRFNVVQDVAVDSGRAYLADSKLGFLVLDVTNPARPVQVGGLPITAFPGFSAGQDPQLVRVAGGLALVGSPCFLVDIRTPEAPVVLGPLGDGLRAADARMANARVYVAARAAGLQIFDDRLGIVQKLTFEAPAEVFLDEGSVPLAPRAGSGLAVECSVVNGPGRFEGGSLGGTNVLVLEGVGEVAIRAIQAGTDFWLPASSERTIRIRKRPHEIVWRAPAMDVLELGQAYPLVAESSRGLPVSYALEAGPARVEGDRLTVTNYGLVRISARAAGDGVVEDAFGWRVFRAGESGGRRIGAWPLTHPLPVLGFGPRFARDIVLGPSHAYIAMASQGVGVFDLTRAESPEFVGAVWIDGHAVQLALEGDLLYVAADYAGLVLVDVAEPARPWLVSSAPHRGGARSLAVVNGYAYVAHNQAPFAVYDVSRRASPRLVGQCEMSGFGSGITVTNGFAYVADGDAGVVIIDVRDPSDPRRAGVLPTAGSAWDIAVRGQTGFGTTYARSGELFALDLSDPAALRRIATLTLGGDALGLALEEDLAAVCLNGGLALFNVSDPERMQELGRISLRGALDVALRGGKAYVASGEGGVSVIDVSRPSAPQGLGTLPLADARDVVVRNGTVYLANGRGGLVLLDGKDPANLRRLGGVSVGTEVMGVAEEKGLAYLAEGNDGMAVVDCSDLARPVRTGWTGVPGRAADIAVRAGVAYLASAGNGVGIVDATSPREPRFLAFLASAPGQAEAVEVAGNWLGVANGSAGVSLYDISVPRAPRLVSQTVLPEAVLGVAFDESRLVVNGAAGGFFLLDLADPRSPASLGEARMGGMGGRVVAHGGTAWALSRWGSFRVFDFQVPGRPVGVGEFSIAGQAHGVDVSDNRVFVAAGAYGLQVWETRLGKPQYINVSHPYRVAMTNGPLVLTPTASSGLPVTFSVTEGPATLKGAVLQPLGPGQVRFLVEQAGDAQWLPCIADLAIEFVKVEQAIAWADLPIRLVPVGTSMPVRVSADSGLPVSLAVAGGPASLVGETLTVTNEGAVHLVAEQAGNASYLPVISERWLNRPGVHVASETRWPGYLRAGSAPFANVMVREPHVLVVTERGELLVFDVTNGGEPALLSRLESPPEWNWGGWPRALSAVLDDSRVYLPGGNRLWSIDVSDPLRPRHDLAYEPPGPNSGWGQGNRGECYGVATAAGHLFAVGYMPFTVFDGTSSAPLRGPVGNARLGTDSWHWRRVALGNGIACVAGGSRLTVVDLANPYLPQASGLLDLQGDVRDLAVTGEVAIVGLMSWSDGQGEVQTIDIRDRSHPRALGKVKIDGEVHGLCLANGVAYLAAGNAGLVVVDTNVPEAPVRLGMIDTPGDARAVQVVGHRAYVADGPGGLAVIDVTNPGAPAPASLESGAGWAHEIRMSGDFAYVADGPAGLAIIDLKAPGGLTNLTRFPTAGAAVGVAIEGTRVYVATGTQGIVAVDVTDPRHPRELGRVGTGGNARSAVVLRGVGYVANDVDGLAVLDLSAPERYRRVRGVPTGSRATGLAAGGNRIAVALPEAGEVRVFDIADPLIPRRLGSYPLVRGSSGFAIAMDGARLATVARMVPLQRIEVHDLDAAAGTPPVAVFETGVEVGGLALLGSRLYAGLPSAGGSLAVIDFRRLDHPFEVGRTPCAGLVERVAADGDRVAVAMGAAGIAVLEDRFGWPQELTFALADAADVADGPLTLTASTDSGLPLAWSVTGGPAILSGGVLMPTGSGRVTVRVEQAGDAAWLPASVERTIEFRQSSQTIEWREPAGDWIATGATVRLAARSNQGLPVRFRLERGPASLDGDRLTVTNPGTLYVLAEQPGTAAVTATSLARVFNARAAMGMKVGSETGSPGSETGASDIEVFEDRAFLATYPAELRVINVSSPENPLSAGVETVAEWTGNLRIHGQTLYAGTRGGLTVYDLSTRPMPRQVAVFEGLGNPLAVDDRVALLAGDGSIDVLELKPGPALTHRSRLVPRGWGRFSDAALHGTLAVAVGGQDGLTVFDLADPARPRPVSALAVDGNATSLAISGHHAFLVVAWKGVLAVDLADPKAPRAVGMWPMDGELLRIMATGDLVCVTRASEVVLLDVANPAFPFEVGRIADPGYAPPLRVVGSRMYLAGATGLQILDLRYGWHQGITFALPAEVPENTAPLALKAVAGSGLEPVEFAILTGPGVLLDGALSWTGRGRIGVRASQAGDALWLPADVETSVLVRSAHLAGLVRDWLGEIDPKLPASVTSPVDDPDGDGAGNAIEFVLGTPPLEGGASHGVLPSGRIEAVAGQPRWVVEFDLGPAVPAWIAVEAESATGGWPWSWEKVPAEATRRDGTRVRVTLPADDEGRFLRLKVPLE